MIITRTIEKKALEKIVSETYDHFGTDTTSCLLDTLKLMGFHYATNSGISISIEDLKIPGTKTDLVNSVQKELDWTSEQWDLGYISELERFKKILDSWGEAANLLREKITDFYQSHDPFNSLYTMSSSGARGNMTQVRQVIGMRGLMADQEGNIINLPIKSSFREGLSIIDYLISAYGARKGVVDTALKTAEAGYLTRRLIFVAQDLIIKEIDCKTQKGISYTFWGTNKEEIRRNQEIYANPKIRADKLNNWNHKKLIGRVFLNYTTIENFSASFSNEEFKKNVFGSFSPSLKDLILTEEKLEKLKKYLPHRTIINFRSPLTCEAKNTICQYCYGIDFAEKDLVELGKPIGTLAAQSIGEPGTQLTMRTFHTGGVVNSQAVAHLTAKKAGKFIMPSSFKITKYRTEYGEIIYKLEEKIICLLYPVQGEILCYSLQPGYLLHIISTGFVSENQIIAEYPKTFIKQTKIKPVLIPIDCRIYSPFTQFDYASEIFKNQNKEFHRIKKSENNYDLLKFLSRNTSEITKEQIKKSKRKMVDFYSVYFKKRFSELNVKPLSDYILLKNDKKFLLAAGKISHFPKESEIYANFYLYENKSIAKLKIVAPMTGVFSLSSQELICLENYDKKKNSIFDFHTTVYQKQLLIWKNKRKIHLPLDFFLKKALNFSGKFFCIKQNFEKVEKDSILAYAYFFPSFSEPLHFVQQENTYQKISFFPSKKYQTNSLNGESLLSCSQNLINGDLVYPNLIDTNEENYNQSIKKIFFLCESDVWRIHLEGTRNELSKKKKQIVKFDDLATPGTSIGFYGRFLKKEGFKFLYQRITALCFTSGSFVKCKNGEFLPKNFSIGKVLTTTQRASDIIQGLPKIEKYIEASKGKPKEFSLYNSSPCILENSQIFLEKLTRIRQNLKIEYYEKKEQNLPILSVKKFFKQGMSFPFYSKKIFEKITQNSLELYNTKINSATKNFSFTYSQSAFFLKKNFSKTKALVMLQEDVLSSKKLAEFLANSNLPGVLHSITSLEKNTFYEIEFVENNNEFHDYLINTNLTKAITKYLSNKKDLCFYLFDPIELKFEKWIELSPICGLHYISKLPNKEINEKEIIANNEKYYESCPTIRFEFYFFSSKVGFFKLRKVLQRPSFEKDFYANFFSKSFKKGQFCSPGQIFRKGMNESPGLIQLFSKIYQHKYPVHKGANFGTLCFQLVWVKGINKIYEEQGVNIGLKHFELIVRQMTRKAKILGYHDEKYLTIPFIQSDIVTSSYLYEVAKLIYEVKNQKLFVWQKGLIKVPREKYFIPLYEPLVIGSSRTAMEKHSLFAAAGFQSTKNVLMKAAVQGKKEWFHGLKESIVSGKLIPAGTSFSDRVDHLDYVYYYQKEIIKKKNNEYRNK